MSVSAWRCSSDAHRSPLAGRIRSATWSKNASTSAPPCSNGNSNRPYRNPWSSRHFRNDRRSRRRRLSSRLIVRRSRAMRCNAIGDADTARCGDLLVGVLVGQLRRGRQLLRRQLAVQRRIGPDAAEYSNFSRRLPLPPRRRFGLAITRGLIRPQPRAARRAPSSSPTRAPRADASRESPARAATRDAPSPNTATRPDRSPEPAHPTIQTWGCDTYRRNPPRSPKNIRRIPRRRTRRGPDHTGAAMSAQRRRDTAAQASSAVPASTCRPPSPACITSAHATAGGRRRPRRRARCPCSRPRPRRGSRAATRHRRVRRCGQTARHHPLPRPDQQVDLRLRTQRGEERLLVLRRTGIPRRRPPRRADVPDRRTSSHSLHGPETTRPGTVTGPVVAGDRPIEQDAPMALGVDGMGTGRVLLRATFLSLGTLVFVAGLTLTSTSMRAVMDIGGSCASGGPYERARGRGDDRHDVVGREVLRLRRRRVREAEQPPRPVVFGGTGGRLADRPAPRAARAGRSPPAWSAPRGRPARARRTGTPRRPPPRRGAFVSRPRLRTSSHALHEPEATRPRTWLLRRGPVGAEADVDGERHAQLGTRAPSRRARAPRSSSRSLSGTSSTSSSCTVSSMRGSRVGVVERAVEVDHRQLEDVGGRSLHRRVLRHALPHLADAEVVGRQLARSGGGGRRSWSCTRAPWPRGPSRP